MSVGVDRPFSGTGETVHNSMPISSMVEPSTDNRVTVVRFYYAVPLPGRLTVGRQILTLAIVVRIHAGQPILHMFITHYKATL